MTKSITFRSDKGPIPFGREGRDNSIGFYSRQTPD